MITGVFNLPVKPPLKTLLDLLGCERLRIGTMTILPICFMRIRGIHEGLTALLFVITSVNNDEFERNMGNYTYYEISCTN